MTSWLDDSTLVHGGMLFGMMTLNTGSGDNGQTATSEGSTKANRRNYIPLSFYSNITSVPTLSFEKSLQNGSLLGHQAWPMIHPFGFGSTTLNWPAAGLAAFSNGSLDTVLTSWCTTLNAQLSAAPFLIRLFREMTNNVTIYGPNGAANGGVNETPASFIAAWQYIVSFIRSRVTNARFVWCPDSAQSVATAAALYPGDAYVDWIGVDGYKTSATSYSLANVQTWYAAFKPGGTQGLSKPIMLCETGVNVSDASRVADMSAFTADLNSMPLFKAVVFFDSAPAGPYYVADSPAGFLSAFQTVVGSDPLQGRVISKPMELWAHSGGIRVRTGAFA